MYMFLTPEYWDCAIRQDTGPENHPAGSCKMGPPSDPMAVVDPELRVYGIRGLRVADASIMPQVENYGCYIRVRNSNALKNSDTHMVKKASGLILDP